MYFIIIYLCIIRFCQDKKLKMRFEKKNMLLIIAMMTLFNWVIAMWWYIFNKVTVKNDYTANKREFIRCEYHPSKIIRYNIYIIIKQFK